ncbi:hypothetical protein Tola_2405 [Tolumonas auensis DSM 9187]|uniref:Uncharacterized protein n=1 Tax=Tolumonas auensis (strain DSM 9187 / NBRC 110442 / TA 4) TaxID=595494 RepID=C4L9P9_TOLAT|nr:hypothetical protein Tola_2405 [Tolumonas auensis DSM 9187]
MADAQEKTRRRLGAFGLEEETTRVLVQVAVVGGTVRCLSIHPALVVVGAGIVWRTSAHKGSPFFSPVGAGVEYRQP